MRYVPLLLLLLLPIQSHAAILFSEIAWMGTSENANDEWIELYNHDSGSVNVDGWSISDGVALDISLTGTIPGRTIVLLERSDDSTVPSVAAFQIYTGALANEGRTLTLRRADGTTEDRVVGGENWTNIGGDNVTKKTPQATMTGWVTGVPTPGAPNVEHDDGSEEEESENDDATDSGKSTASKKDDGSSVRISLVESDNELNLTFSSDDIAYVNQPVTFTSEATGIGKTIINSLVYRWNFGDTYTGNGREVTHTYRYPGDYIVVLNATYGDYDVTVRKVVKVLPVSITLSRTHQGDIVLTNNAGHDVDLSGYVLKGTENLVLPKDTFVLKGGSMIIPKSRVTSNTVAMIALYDAEKAIVASEMSATPRSASFALATPQASGPASHIASHSAPTSRVSRIASSEMSDTRTTAQREGDVAGTSTIFENLTIPVYAAEEVPTPSRAPQNILPYIGLVAVIIVATALLYRRPTGPREHE